MKQRNAFVLTLIALIFSSPLQAQAYLGDHRTQAQQDRALLIARDNRTQAQKDRDWSPRTLPEILNHTDYRVTLEQGNLPNMFIFGGIWSVFNTQDNTKQVLAFDPNGTMAVTTWQMVPCLGGWCDHLILDTQYAHWFLFSGDMKIYWLCLVYTQPVGSLLAEIPQPTKDDNFYCWWVQFPNRDVMLGPDGSTIGYYVYMAMNDPVNSWEAWYTNPVPFPADRPYATVEDFAQPAIRDTVCYGNICSVGR